MSRNRILIVDDEPDVLEFLSYNFRKQCIDVACACNGEEGIKKVAEFNPDVILSDVMMPVMDGIAMAKVLKNSDKSKNIPLIFLSSLQDDYQVMSAGITGDDYISKPIPFPDLLHIVEKHFAKKKALAS